MADTLDPKYLDKRTAERYLRSGQLDEGTYERHLKDLPDVADKSVAVETAMDGEEFFDDEDDAGDEAEETAASTEDGGDEDGGDEDGDEDEDEDEEGDEDEDDAADEAAKDTETP
jgi:hypothetical protein